MINAIYEVVMEMAGRRCPVLEGGPVVSMFGVGVGHVKTVEHS